MQVIKQTVKPTPKNIPFLYYKQHSQDKKAEEYPETH